MKAVESHTIEVYLTKPQFKKLDCHQPFQMSYQQLAHPENHKNGDHHCEIHLPTKEHKRLLRAIKAQRGFRFTPDKILGGSFLGFLKKGADAVKKYVPKEIIKKGVNFAADKIGEATGQTGLADKAKNFINNKIDDHYDSGQTDSDVTAVPVTASQGSGFFSDLFGGELKGSPQMKAKMAKLRSMRGKNMHGDGFFDNLKSLASNPAVQSLGKMALNKGLDIASQSSNPYLSGASNLAKSVTGGKLKKGSPEAKEKMARLRAMRGKGLSATHRVDGKGFGSFFRSIGNVAKKAGNAVKNVATDPKTLSVLKQVGQTAAPIALGLAASNPYTAGIANVASQYIPPEYGGVSGTAAQQDDTDTTNVGSGLRHKRVFNDCSPLVKGLRPNIVRKNGRIKGFAGGSFREL